MNNNSFKTINNTKQQHNAHPCYMTEKIKMVSDQYFSQTV